MLELKLITPFSLLNYAAFMEKNFYYEESFKVYELGLSIFPWPGLYDLWMIYLNKFVSRYGDKKLERCRDLFEKVLSYAPKKVKKNCDWGFFINICCKIFIFLKIHFFFLFNNKSLRKYFT